MSECVENNVSLAVRPGQKSEIPFTPEELLHIGEAFVALVCKPGPAGQDAAKEFADAAWKATPAAEHCRNIRAFQIKAGKWAALRFLRKEHSRRELEEHFLRERAASRVICGDIVDESAPDPLQMAIVHEEAARVMAKLNTLPEREQDIFRKIVLEDCKINDLAQEYGISRQSVHRIYQQIARKLRAVCTPGIF